MIYNAGLVSLIIFLCVFGGALLGIRLNALVPQRHLDDQSKDVIRGGMAVVATMVALVLGLLIAGAKSYFDTQQNELTQLAANVVLVDRMLDHYGPDAGPERALLKAEVSASADDLFSLANRREAGTVTKRAEALYDTLEALEPKTDEQRSAKTQALAVMVEIGRLRWLMYAQSATQLPIALVVLLGIWLVLVSVTSGLFTRPNPTVIVSFFASALAVASAVWLILELYNPYLGWIRVSEAPLRAALAQLGN